MKQILLKRELRGDAAGGFRSTSLEETIGLDHMKEVLLERELRGGAAGSYRSRAFEGGIEVEHLKKLKGWRT